MSGRRPWDEASLLTTLPKDLGLTYEPTEDGGWSAQLIGIPLSESSGATEEEAERGVYQALYDLMQARCELAQNRCAAAQPGGSRGVSADSSDGAGVGVASGVDVDSGSSEVSDDSRLATQVPRSLGAAGKT